MASNPFAGFAGRVSQFRQAFGNTRTVDPKLVPLVAGVGLGVLLVCALVGVLTGYPVLGTVAGVSLGLSGALLVFGQRASRAAIGSIEGRPGAAAAVLQSMRGPWLVTPAVAFTRKQEFVHRVVGRPGIILVGEGSPARVAALLRQEKRRVARVAGETPVHEVSVGDGDGQVPLRQLQMHLSRLPRALKAGAVGPLETRLSALGTSDPPLPKGPMPRGRRG